MEEKGAAGLPHNAYTPLEEGETYRSYIPASKHPPEITTRSVLWGLVMSVVFTAAAAYLGLKIGQVFEAAIPIAILAVGISGLYARRSTILENVIIQSIGAASGVVVAGAIFTIPALYILELEADFLKIFLASLFGGFLGILFLIPLRRYFCRDMHGYLPFPEATATTEVLVTGEARSEQASVLLKAAALGGVYDFAIATFGLWREVISTRVFEYGAMLADRARIVVKVNSIAAVLGLGYIVGLKYAAIICAGSFVSWLVLIPSIWYFGQHVDITLLPSEIPLSQMDAEAIFNSYVRHIGIGGIAAAGILGIIKNSKIIVQAFTLGFREIFSKKPLGGSGEKRTDTDLPMSLIVVLIILAFLAVLVFFRASVVESWKFAVIAFLLTGIIAFLFTTVAARAIAIVGINPVSGMTLMTLILSSVILVKVGLSGPGGMVSALIIGTVVCTALSMSGGFITDLKIGYWIGSSPYNQERFKFLGTLVAALTVGGVILLLNRVYGFVLTPEHPSPLAAPQANAMAAVLNVLFQTSHVPWGLYGAGIFMALTMELIGISPLAFALGMYLPIELNTPILIGGIISHLVSKSSGDSELNTLRKEKGTLIASGFIAGGPIMGVVSALLALFMGDRLDTGIAERPVGEVVSVVLYLGLCYFLYRYATSISKKS